MVIGLIVALGVGLWARSDAKTLEARGIRVGATSATSWFWGVFLLMIVFGPIYLIQRSKALAGSHASQVPLVPPRSAPPGWYPDPTSPQENRWWDGWKWTEQTSPVAGNGWQAPVTR